MKSLLNFCSYLFTTSEISYNITSGYFSSYLQIEAIDGTIAKFSLDDLNFKPTGWLETHKGRLLETLYITNNCSKLLEQCSRYNYTLIVNDKDLGHSDHFDLKLITQNNTGRLIAYDFKIINRGVRYYDKHNLKPLPL